MIMNYMFGKLVTAEEKAFFSNILARKTDRVAQGKYFKAVYNTAKRENVSLIEAYDILELQGKKVQKLNEMVHNERVYFVDKDGEISKNQRDALNDHTFKVKVSAKELNDIEHGVVVNPTQAKPSFFSDAKKYFKRGWQLFKEALTVY